MALGFADFRARKSEVTLASGIETETRPERDFRYSESRLEDVYDLRVQSHFLRGVGFGTHLHGEFVLDFTTSGFAKMYAGGREFLLQPNTVSILGPNVPHSTEVLSKEGWSFTSIYIDRGTLSSLMGESIYLPESIVYSAKLIESSIACRVCELLSGPQEKPLSPEAKQKLFSGLLDLLVDEFFVKDDGVCAQQKNIAATLGILNARYSENLDIKEIAGEIGLTPNHLTTAFKRYVGVPPHKYLVAKRLSEAASLLRSTIPISEIAHSCGFYDQSHFTEHFRRVMLITPMQYRMLSLKS